MAVVPGWVSEEQHEKKVQEYGEKVLLAAKERMRIFNQSFPLFDELYREEKIA